MSKKYRTINHTADIGMRVFGSDLPEAFANAGRGLFSLITDLRKVRCSLTFEIEVNASDQSELLVVWLNELLFHFETEQILFKEFSIRHLTTTGVKAACRGERVDRRRHTLKRAIKSATYHMLKIEPAKNGYEIVVLLDI